MHVNVLYYVFCFVVVVIVFAVIAFMSFTKKINYALALGYMIVLTVEMTSLFAVALTPGPLATAQVATFLIEYE